MYSSLQLNIPAMKTRLPKILICCLLLSINQLSYAQYLHINGMFFKARHKMTKATYTLKYESNILNTGRRRKIKLALTLNKEYTLILTNLFSTYIKSDTKVFNFDAL